MKVVVKQGSVLLPLLFICVMDVLTDGVRGKCNSLMYVDNMVLIGVSLEEVMGRMKSGRKHCRTKD